MRWQGWGNDADGFMVWRICHALRKRKGYIERNVGVEGVENLGYHW